MSKAWDQALEEEAGTLLLFGPPEGIKLDPRFPMPVSVRRGGETVHYVSRQEAEFGLKWRNGELEKVREIVERLGNGTIVTVTPRDASVSVINGLSSMAAAALSILEGLRGD